MEKYNEGRHAGTAAAFVSDLVYRHSDDSAAEPHLFLMVALWASVRLYTTAIYTECAEHDTVANQVICLGRPLPVPDLPQLSPAIMRYMVPFRDINVHASASHYAFTSPSSPSAQTLVVERPSGDLRLNDGALLGTKRVSSIAGILGMIKLRLGESHARSTGEQNL